MPLLEIETKLNSGKKEASKEQQQDQKTTRIRRFSKPGQQQHQTVKNFHCYFYEIMQAGPRSEPTRILEPDQELNIRSTDI